MIKERPAGNVQWPFLEEWLNLSRSLLEEVKRIVLLSRVRNHKLANITAGSSKGYKNYSNLAYQVREADQNFDECLVIDIYFNRKNSSVKVLIEKWVVNLTSDKGGGDNTTRAKFTTMKDEDNLDPPEKSLLDKFDYPSKDNLLKVNYKKYRKIFAVKKLSTILRTVYVYSRSLPAFEVFLKTGFDYTLESTFDSSCTFAGDQNLSSLKKSFKHKCDINIGIVNFEVHYLDKSEIFHMEQLAQEKATHHRFLSERVVTHFKPEEYKSAAEVLGSLDLKRVGSRSLDNYPILSDLDPEENNFVIKDFSELLNFGMEKEKTEISKLNLKIKHLKNDEDKTILDDRDEYVTSEDSDFENEDYWNVFNSEEILEIADDSSNFFLQEETEPKVNLRQDLFLALKHFKKEVDQLPKLKMNVISLYQCVNKN